MRPTVLCFSGLDPSGGAGLQADIEAIGAAGAHTAVICTALTIQNSQRVFGFECVDSTLLERQTQAVLQDLPIRAIKSGMLGSPTTVQLLHKLFDTQQITHGMPYVLDPVLSANTGGALGDKATLVQALKTLLPFTTLITPNSHELRLLTNLQDLHAGAKRLCQLGAKAVLVKTSHDFMQSDFQQFLYIEGVLAYETTVRRLDGEFHGSGCTLASHIAARLSLGDNLITAVQRADDWIYRTLQHADAPQPHNTHAQKLPNRFIR